MSSRRPVIIAVVGPMGPLQYVDQGPTEGCVIVMHSGMHGPKVLSV